MLLLFEQSGTTPPPSPPTTPTGLAVSVLSDTRIDLTWSQTSTNEDGFKIERKTGVGGAYAEIARVGINVVSFSDTPLIASTQYVYRIRAYNDLGDSSYSNEASGTTNPTPLPSTAPSAPTGLVATSVSAIRIDLAWTDNSSNESGFRVERKEGLAGTYAEILVVGANVTSLQDTPVTAGIDYYYRVRAYNAVGDSPYSNEVHAIPEDPPPPPPPPPPVRWHRKYTRRVNP